MGKKLTIYLIDGTENGARTIDIGNWSGKAINCPRTSLLEIIKREEYDNPGIYILKSNPQRDIYGERIYIGEAESIRARLKQHLRDQDKDFIECVVFISKDDMLTKSHIKYIESRLIQMAFETRNAEIENIKKPPLNTLSEADISDMEFYIQQLKLILPVVGYDFLKSDRVESLSENINEEVFSIRGKKATAKMRETKEGFVVLKGSQASMKESASINPGWSKIRNKLIANGLLVAEHEHYVFVEDTVFNSVSAAASVVLGRQAAGPLQWIDQNKKTYKDYITETIDNN